MFKEPLSSWLSSSIIGRAERQGIFSTRIESILESVDNNHHLIDDTPYGGGPGQLMKIDVIAPLINKALAHNPKVMRNHKRVVLMDPAARPFTQNDAKRLATYQELIFVCGRYEGIDARIHYYVDEALSLGDFVLSSGDLAAMAMFDATARMLDGVLGNLDSIVQESHCEARLEGSQYTRPASYNGHDVPEVFQQGNHKEIAKWRLAESVYKTKKLRPDLVAHFPLNEDEKKILTTINCNCTTFPWEQHG